MIYSEDGMTRIVDVIANAREKMIDENDRNFICNELQKIREDRLQSRLLTEYDYDRERIISAHVIMKVKLSDSLNLAEKVEMIKLRFEKEMEGYYHKFTEKKYYY